MQQFRFDYLLAFDGKLLARKSQYVMWLRIFKCYPINVSHTTSTILPYISPKDKCALISYKRCSFPFSRMYYYFQCQFSHAKAREKIREKFLCICPNDLEFFQLLSSRREIYSSILKMILQLFSLNMKLKTFAIFCLHRKDKRLRNSLMKTYLKSRD